MKIIAVLNQKGGSSKTTIATHLARALQLDGRQVVLVDSDPQGSARDWAAVDEANPVPVVGLDRPTLDRDVRALHGYDIAVIDGAPQTSALATAALRCADLVLIPAQPSPYDVWAASELVDLVKQRQAIADGRPAAAFIVSRAIVGTRLGAEIEQTLTEYGLPVLHTAIHQRVDYPSSAAAGKTVFDSDASGKAASEVRELAKEVLTLLETP